jgi:hypothetical protein
VTAALPFRLDEPLALEPAVAFIGAVVYPTQDHAGREKRVRERLRYQRRLPRGGRIANPREFFGWAATVKGWGALASVPGVPLVIAPPSGTFEITGYPTVVIIEPIAEADLRVAFRAQQLRLRELEPDAERWRRHVARAAESGRTGGKSRSAK